MMSSVSGPASGFHVRGPGGVSVTRPPVRPEASPAREPGGDSWAPSGVEAPVAGPSPVDAPSAAPVAAPERAPAAAPPPDVLLEEASNAQAGEDMSWVIDAAAQSVYAGEPAVATLQERFPHLPEDVRTALATPLLEALTTDDPESARAGLGDLASTATWAQKFKKDARALVAEGGSEALVAHVRSLQASSEGTSASLLDGVLAAPSLLFSSELSQGGVQEANQLLDQFQKGNDNPGIGTKTLGKGVCYLRGRKGTRLFYRMEEGKPSWLAVCDKSTEPKAIGILRRELDLR